MNEQKPEFPLIRAIPELYELLQIFALSELEQERYWPEDWQPRWITFGDYDTEATDVRFLGLCALDEAARSGEPDTNAEFASLCSEIRGLAQFIRESSASVVWRWMVWHPRRVRENNGCIVVDEILYRVWDVLRRLCREAVEEMNWAGRPRPFAEVFARA